MTETSKTSIGGYAISRRLPGPGESYQARSPSGDRVLVRVLARPTSDEAWEQLQQDIAICRALEHPAIAKPTDVFEDGPTLALVYEYFEGSKLSQLMRRPISKGKLQGPAAWHIAHQLVGAIAQGHAATDAAGVPAPICHGHIAPAQVLVSVHGDVRVEGLGIATLAGSDDAPVTAGYQAPEEVGGGRVTPRGDLYSAAMLLWGMLTGSDPQAPGSGPDFSRLEELAPPAVLAVIRLSAEAKVGRRKITSMEVEQALAEAFDGAEGKSAAANAAKALAQSGRTLAGTGGMVLGLMGAQKAPAGPIAGPAKSVPTEEPAAPVIPAAAGGGSVLGPGMRRAGASSAQPDGGRPKEPAAESVPLVPGTSGPRDGGAGPVARARVGGGSKRPLRQATLLGSWNKTQAAETPAPEKTESAGATAAPTAGPPVDLSGRAATPSPKKPAGVGFAGGTAGLKRPSFPAPVAPTTDRQAGSADGDDSLDLEAAMLGATVTADAPETVTDPEPEPPTLLEPQPEPGVSRSGPEIGLSDVVTVPLPPKGGMAPATIDMPVAVREDPPAGGALDALGGLGAERDPHAPTPTGATLDLSEAADPSVEAPSATRPDLSTTPAVNAAPHTATLWSAPNASRVAEEPAGKPLSWTAAVIIALATMVLTAAAGIWWTRRQVGLVEVSPPEPTVGATASATAAPSATASASSGGVTPTAASSASAAATAEPSGAAADGRDGKDLPPDRGLLRVDYTPSEGAEIFVYGKSFGPTGQAVDVPCGRRFIRVGKMPGPSWLSEGQSVDIACQGVTTVTLKPQ